MTAPIKGIQCKSIPYLKTCVVCAQQEREDRRQIYAEASRISQAINDYVNKQYAATGTYNPNLKKENTVAVTTPAAEQFTPTAVRTTVSVPRTYTAKESRYTITLSEHQAGYLIDLLQAHVAGEISQYLQPISKALKAAGASRRYATNTNTRHSGLTGYKYQVAVMNFAGDTERELAGVPTKSQANTVSADYAF